MDKHEFEAGSGRPEVSAAAASYLRSLTRASRTSALDGPALVVSALFLYQRDAPPSRSDDLDNHKNHAPSAPPNKVCANESDDTHRRLVYGERRRHHNVRSVDAGDRAPTRFVDPAKKDRVFTHHHQWWPRDIETHAAVGGACSQTVRQIASLCLDSDVAENATEIERLARRAEEHAADLLSAAGALPLATWVRVSGLPLGTAGPLVRLPWATAGPRGVPTYVGGLPDPTDAAETVRFWNTVFMRDTILDKATATGYRPYGRPFLRTVASLLDRDKEAGSRFGPLPDGRHPTHMVDMVVVRKGERASADTLWCSLIAQH